MPESFSDNKATIDGGGNFTLGKAFSDAPVGNVHGDNAYDTTYTYAKGDAFLPIPPALWQQAIGATAAFTTPVFTGRVASGSAGLPVSASLGTASVTYNFQFPLSHVARTYTGVGHGFLLKGLIFSYIVAGASLSAAPTVVFFHETLTNLTARANTIFGGTVTYENPIGTTIGAGTVPIAATAVPYMVKAIVGTPAWITTLGDHVWAEVAIANGTGGSATLVAVDMVGSVAIY